MSPLHEAAQKGQLEKVQGLLKDNADLVSSKDSDGLTPLHLASAMGHKAVAEFLLANKADVNATSKILWTPLHQAAFNGRIDVATLLLAHGADVHAKDDKGHTALHWAASRKHSDVAELLRHAEANQAKESPTKGSNWYLAEDKSRALRQVVLTSDPERKTVSRFSSRAILTYPRQYSELMNASPLATGFFRLDSDPGPYLLIRTDGTWSKSGREVVDDMTSAHFRVAITFVHLPTSGLLAIFVSSGVLQMVSQRGFLEKIYGLDDDTTRTLASDAINKDALQIVLAGDSGWKYDVEIPFDSACKQVLTREWEAVLSHHRTIRAPDFGAAGRRLYELVPEGSDPILAK